MADAPKNNWLVRVLGIAGAASTTQSGPRPKLTPIFLEAKDTVDVSIRKLQDKLREEDDDDLNQIVEYGLFGATEGQTVRLMAALREWDGGVAGAEKPLQEAIEAYQDYLDSSAPILDLLEDNEWKVVVPVRTEIGKALDKMARAMAG